MNHYISLLIGLVGAIIGASASIITMIIQLHAQNRRERLRMAAELAMQDYKATIDLTKNMKGDLAPPVVYLHYYIMLMELLEKKRLNPDTLKLLAEENQKISDVIEPLRKKT